MNARVYGASTGQRGRLMYPLEPQTIPRIGKIPSRGQSAVPVLSSQKLSTRRISSLCYN